MAANLSSGKIDLWLGLSTLPAFKGTTYVGESEILTVSMQSFSLPGKPFLKSQQDLNNKTIIVMRGYSYGGWIEYIKNPDNKVNYIEVNSYKSALRLLEIGRADYLLSYQSAVDKALVHYPIYKLQRYTLSSFTCHFIVSRRSHNAQQLLAKIERSYQQLLANGKL